MDAADLNEEPEEGDTAMEAEELYCVVCKKAFKNEKSVSNWYQCCLTEPAAGAVGEPRPLEETLEGGGGTEA